MVILRILRNKNQENDYMKKKFIMFLLAILFIVPSAFLLTACSQEEPIFNGYKVYINGTKTDEFSCTSGETAITAENVSVKTDWTDESLNTELPLSDFEISVEWRNQFNSQETTFPAFWTNGTGSTTNDYATTYNFTLTLKSDSVWQTTFSVIISPIIVSNCRVRIFDGVEYKYSVEMVWGHNDRESDPEKHFRFDIENLDEGYDQQEHIQWAVIEKNTYESLETPEQQKDFITASEAFSTGQIYQHYTPGTYYVFAYVPDWNNHNYGLYGDGKIYNYATLTIKPIELVQTPETHVLSHSESKSSDFTYFSFDTTSELTANIDYDYSQAIFTQPYAYVDGCWTVLDKHESNGYEKSIKVHAVLTADGYKLVDLKDIETSLHEWVFINDDGSQGDDVTDNSAIVLIDYKDLAKYKTINSITIPTYYMAEDVSLQGIQLDCSQLYRTEITIWKHAVNPIPNVDIGGGDANTNKFITGHNTFEFIYGDQVKIGDHEVWDTQQIMRSVLDISSRNCYYFEGFDQTEPSDEPYYGYIKLNSPHFRWRLDGVNYTSDPLVITYYIHPAEA